MVPTVKVILWFRRLGNGVGCRRLSGFVFPLRGRENKNLEPPPAYPSKFGSGVGDSMVPTVKVILVTYHG